MIALKSTGTCSACHSQECMRRRGALELETIVVFARVKRATAQCQGQAVLDAKGQAHEQFPHQRRWLVVGFDHQKRHIAIGVCWSLAADLNVCEHLVEELTQLVGSEFFDVKRVVAMP